MKIKTATKLRITYIQSLCLSLKYTCNFFFFYPAYRLFTVIPRLVKFVDQLTNWYVRMNRKRLKVSKCLKSLFLFGSFFKNLNACQGPQHMN